MTVCVGEHAYRAWRGAPQRIASERIGGFSLVELVVASALMATLMFGLWGTVHLYTSLRDRGIAKLEQIREATELFHTLESDLRSALDATLPGGMASFSGDAKSLTLAQIAPVALAWGDDAARMPSDRGLETAASPPLPEVVRRVRYQWIEVDEGFGDSPDASLEPLPSDADLALLDANGFDGRPTERVDSPGLWRYDEQKRDFGPESQLGGMPATWRFANVEAVRFRYYNGKRWRTRWDSATQGRLPAAVRIEAWFFGGTTLGPRRMASVASDESDERYDVGEDESAGAPSAGAPSAAAERSAAELDVADGVERAELEGADEAIAAVPERPADLIRWVSLR